LTPQTTTSGLVVTVHGAGRQGLREPENVLEAGNSGTTMRLLAGVLAGQPFLSVISGDSSLRRRPMGRIIEPLRLMGADVRGRVGDARAPLVIRGGRLKGITYDLPVASAQVKSALLLAGLSAEGETRLREPAQSRDHTERLLHRMGAVIDSGDGWVQVRALDSDLAALSMRVPGDVSACAFWLVAACAHSDARLRLRGVGVNPTRAALIDVLKRMGARITVGPDDGGVEPAADVEVESSTLRKTEIGPELVPSLVDELPALALAACFAEGETTITGAGELRVKESDRIRGAVTLLRAFGADVAELTDGLLVRGRGKLHAARVSSLGDHRLAMLAGVAGLLAEGETEIAGAETASVSYPEFWRDLRYISGEG